MANNAPVKLAHSVFVPANGSDETLSPIIFLHGITGTKVYWDDIPQYIADGSKRKVYTLDSRNHGDSIYTEEFTFDLNVVDLFHFMDTINAPKAVLIGHSMGGITAIKAALTKPERIEMIFVEDMFTKNLTEEILSGVIALAYIMIETVQGVPPELSESEANEFAVTEFFKKTSPNMPKVKIPEGLKGKRLILKKLLDGKHDVNFNREVIMAALMDPERVKTNPSGEFNGPAYFIYGSISPFEVIVPVKLAYQTFEPTDGTDESLAPIIFLHGLTSSKEVWDKIPQSIVNSTKRKAYALDSRNHGDSEYTDIFNFDVNVEDLFHFMDTMQIQRAILIGHSMGGFTSIKAALRHPERIEMIFAEDIHVKKLPKMMLDLGLVFIKLWIQIVESIPSHLSEAEAIKFVVDTVFDKIPQGAADFLGRKEDMYNLKFVFHRTSDGKFYVKYNKDVVLNSLSNADTLMSEPSGQFDGPAYFLYGKISHLKVQNEEDHIKKHFPNAELIGFEKATHNVHIEFPDKFTETILQRLK